MTEARIVSELSDLAEAAYVDFGLVPAGGLSGDVLRDKLAEERNAGAWPEARRAAFASTWRVVAHQPNTDSGFSATLFERINPQPGETRYVFAARGTEVVDVGDLRADLSDLVVNGLAWEQIIDMYNWWQELTTPTDGTYLRASAVPINEAEAGQPDTVDALGQDWRIVRTPTLQSLQPRLGQDVIVDVTGHSLGGHLATAFSRLFTANTASVVTINGAGYSMLGDDAVGNTSRVFAALGGQPIFPAASILSIYGDRGPEVVTQDFALGQPGNEHRLARLEDWNWSNTFGHGSGQMSLSLALYDTLRQLEEGGASGMNAATMLTRFEGFLRSGANKQSEDYEGLIDSLRRIVLADNTKTAVGDNASFHSRLIELRDSAEFQAISGHVEVREPGRLELGTLAQTDFSALASLLVLSPVMLQPSDDVGRASLESIWQGAGWSEKYQRWLADRALGIQGELAENFTAQWSADRDMLLTHLVERNRLDAVSGLLQGTTNTDYRDLSSGQTVTVRIGLSSTKVKLVTFGGSEGETINGQLYADRLYGGDGNDTLNGGGSADHLEGNAGDDVLKGGTGEDTLLGGAGNDTLDGGFDADILRGGYGDDRYEFNGGFGDDVIDDPGMGGSVFIDGAAFTGRDTRKTSEVSWESLDRSTYFYWADRTDSAGVVHKDLRITFASGERSLTILDWSQGKLGVTLGDRKPDVPDQVNNTWRQGVTWFPRDPLAIDLDGDGIETVGVGASPILFDHNGDGIRTGTGWVLADDAWLVLDRDGNGTIDSGRELFGVDTEITVNGVTRNAVSGFEALSALDSNGDGVFNASDARFANVRLWRDLNQDGVSQANELLTLADANVASIGLTPSDGTVDLGNGNSINGQVTVTRGDGSITTGGDVSVSGDYSAANLNVADNPFYREFTTSVPLTPEAQALPEVGGSGWVRDLREAMSLGTPEAAALAATVAQFSGAITRAGQMALFDQLLLDWARTNQTQPVTQAWFTDVNPTNGVFDPNAGRAADLTRTLPVLEVFNGQALQGSGALFYTTAATNSATGQTGTVYVISGMPSFYLQAYDSLRDSVYGSLVQQTRLRPHLDAVRVVADVAGVHLDPAPLSNRLAAAWADDQANAITDLIELNRYAGSTLRAVGFDGLAALTSWLDTLAADSPVWDSLGPLGVVRGPNVTGSSDFDVYAGGAGADTFAGGSGDDLVYGAGEADVLTGDGGNDQLGGGTGDDSLFGGAGNDVLDGGVGNDVLDGGSGSNIYLFGRGDGQDTVSASTDPTSGKLNTLRFKAGVAAGDLVFTPVPVLSSIGVLKISISGTADNITINGFPGLDPTGQSSPVQRFEFADGTVWYLGDILANIFPGTSGADFYRGTVYADTLSGQDGDDTLMGYDGDDVLDGGAGDDVLDGEKGNNTYVFGRGDGQDTIVSYQDATPGKLSTLRFKAGVAPGDVLLKQTPGAMLSNLRSLEIGIAGTSDTTTISDFFAAADPQSLGNPIQLFEFDNGTVWDLAQIQAVLFAGTPDDDTFEGTLRADLICGQNGNDSIHGGG